MSAFDAKRPSIPLTKGTAEGQAKRNIIRKSQGTSGFGNRKAGRSDSIDDGSLNPASAALDERDPNYDSEDDGGAGFLAAAAANRPKRAYGDALVGSSKLTLTAYKKAVGSVITEYLVSADIDDTFASLENINAPEYAFEFVKRAITMSLDQNDRERERVSKLLCRGYPNTFSANMIGKAFERLFEMADDTEKDCPNAKEMLSIFLARCIVDEVLPPSFLKDAVVCNLGGSIVDHTKRMLTLGPSGADLERIWGPGDGRPIEEMKLAIDTLLSEFLASSDPDEATRCIKELNAPHYMHEVLKRAITMVLDKGDEAQQAMSNLLIFLIEKDMIPLQQAVTAFRRLHDRLDDLILDVPTAGATLAKFTAWAVEEAILPEGFTYA